MLDGVKEVRLFGEDIAVNAEIAVLHGTSGHADQKGLFNWVEAFAKSRRRFSSTTAIPRPAKRFRRFCRKKGYVAVAPFSGAEFDLLSGKFLAFPAGRPIAKRGAARKKGVFDALIAAAQRLLLVAQSCRGAPEPRSDPLHRADPGAHRQVGEIKRWKSIIISPARNTTAAVS